MALTASEKDESSSDDSYAGLPALLQRNAFAANPSSDESSDEESFSDEGPPALTRRPFIDVSDEESQSSVEIGSPQ